MEAMPEKSPKHILNVRHFRKRLLDDLEVMGTEPLTVVEASAGYGKTVAVREFLRRKGIRSFRSRVKEALEGTFGITENAHKQLVEGWHQRAKINEIFLDRDVFLYAPRYGLDLGRAIPAIVARFSCADQHQNPGRLEFFEVDYPHALPEGR